MKLTKPLFTVGLSAAALLLAACGGGGGSANPLGQSSSAASGSSSASGGGGDAIVVGSANFSESSIVAEIYSQALTAKGVTSSTKLNIGSRELYIKALQDKSISVVPEYTGNLLLNFDKNATATTAAEVEKALPSALPTDLKVLKPSAAVDQDVYVVSKDFAAKNGIASIADLKKVEGKVTLGGPSELQTRAYGPPGLEKLYGIKLAGFKPYDSPAVKTKDLLADKIQVADFFTTDSAIAENGFVQLQDPQAMILPQNVVPLVRSDVASNTTATAAIEAVQAVLTTDDLVALDKKVDVDHQDPNDVAKEWLSSKGLG